MNRFTVDDITPEVDFDYSPMPAWDAYSWRVDRGQDQKAGWVWMPATAPPPSRERIAATLNALAPRLGAALDGRMVGGRGMRLEL
jgi:hypothetical protein